MAEVSGPCAEGNPCAEPALPEAARDAHLVGPRSPGTTTEGDHPPRGLSSHTRSALFDHVLREMRFAAARGADPAELQAAAAAVLAAARQYEAPGPPTSDTDRAVTNTDRATRREDPPVPRR